MVNKNDMMNIFKLLLIIALVAGVYHLYFAHITMGDQPVELILLLVFLLVLNYMTLASKKEGNTDKFKKLMGFKGILILAVFVAYYHLFFAHTAQGNHPLEMILVTAAISIAAYMHLTWKKNGSR